MAKALKAFELSDRLFKPEDNVFLPQAFLSAQYEPSFRDKILCNLFADGFIDDLPVDWLLTEAAKNSLFENPKWAATGYCANCKATDTEATQPKNKR